MGEEHNFSLFKYSNEQAGDIERLQEDIEALHEEETKYEDEVNDDKNGHRHEILNLQTQIKSVEEQTTVYESKCKSHQKILDKVKDEIKVNKSSTCTLFLHILRYSPFTVVPCVTLSSF